MASCFLKPGLRAGRSRLGRPWSQFLSGRGRGFSSSVKPHGASGQRPFFMAVIGSGPAGFYTADRAMRLLGDTARVDMYEALPVPFGLIRFGVAPDHPEVKNCQERFQQVATSPNFSFIGNVSVGLPCRDSGSSAWIPLAALMPHYDAIVFAYGAAKDKTLGIPGESSLNGIYSAREFVGWYNGLPEFAGLAPDLTRGEDAVVIGQGNVALDVARILLEDVDALRESDITEYALAELARSKVKRVHVVGRRGPVQAAFTTKEVRELMKLGAVAFHPVDTSLLPNNLDKLPRPAKRRMEVLLKGSQTPLDDAPKSWSLDFCLSPQAFTARSDDPSGVGATVFDKSSLLDPLDPNGRAYRKAGTAELSSSVVFRSIGYKSIPLPEFAKSRAVAFDDTRGVIRNDGFGRVMNVVLNDDGSYSYAPATGLYCAGWVKSGPTGVVASTMKDAFMTAEAIAQDLHDGLPFLGGRRPGQHDWPQVYGWAAVSRENPEVREKAVEWEDWQKIDRAERERGFSKGKEREKFTATPEMLAVLR